MGSKRLRRSTSFQNTSKTLSSSDPKANKKSSMDAGTKVPKLNLTEVKKKGTFEFLSKIKRRSPRGNEKDRINATKGKQQRSPSMTELPPYSPPSPGMSPVTPHTPNSGNRSPAVTVTHNNNGNNNGNNTNTSTSTSNGSPGTLQASALNELAAKKIRNAVEEWANAEVSDKEEQPKTPKTPKKPRAR